LTRDNKAVNALGPLNKSEEADARLIQSLERQIADVKKQLDLARAQSACVASRVARRNRRRPNTQDGSRSSVPVAALSGTNTPRWNRSARRWSLATACGQNCSVLAMTDRALPGRVRPAGQSAEGFSEMSA